MTPSCWPRSLRVGVYFVLFVCTSASAWMRCCSTGSTSWEILSPSNSVSDGLRRTTAVSWPCSAMYTNVGARLTAAMAPIATIAIAADASTRRRRRAMKSTAPSTTRKSRVNAA